MNTKNILKRILFGVLGLVVLLIVLVVVYSTYFRRVMLSDSVPEIEMQREAKVLTAFFGLQELPMQSLMLYWKGPGKSGMPVVFSQEVDPTTLDNSDFEVITADGKSHEVEFVTLKPANEPFELRTVLLIGNYGTHPDNPPLRVNIVGDLKSRSGQQYLGQSVAAIPLPDGPTISYSEYFVFDEDYPYVKSGAGCDCPREGTNMVVRAVWAGGIRALNGKDPGEAELDAFRVTMVQQGDTVEVKPYAFGDLKDGDNNLDLCLKETGVPIKVRAAANTVMDPRDDPNPETEQTVLSRW